MSVQVEEKRRASNNLSIFGELFFNRHFRRDNKDRVLASDLCISWMNRKKFAVFMLQRTGNEWEWFSHIIFSGKWALWQLADTLLRIFVCYTRVQLQTIDWPIAMQLIQHVHNLIKYFIFLVSTDCIAQCTHILKDVKWIAVLLAVFNWWHLSVIENDDERKWFKFNSFFQEN